MILHIVNGDDFATRLSECGIEGVILPWREVLHEGPLTPFDSFDVTERNAFNRLRAQFMDSKRWGREQDVMRDMGQRDQMLLNRPWNEIVFWSERDLFDQLILAQAMHLLFGTKRFGEQPISLAFSEVHLTTLELPQVAELYTNRSPLTESAALSYSEFFRGLTTRTEVQLSNDAPAALRDAVVKWKELQPDADGSSVFDRRLMDMIKPNSPVGVDALFNMVQTQDGNDAFFGNTSFADRVASLVDRMPQLNMQNNTVHWTD